jgi:NAD(P)-dependent dehydrogenase (short-subunit alcohol dehydrogenase family)
MNGEISYDPLETYGQSKLANILFTRELAKRLKGTGVTANSLHPGAVASELGRHYPKWLIDAIHPVYRQFSKSPREGAQTSIYLAVSEEVQGVTGLYFADCNERIPGRYAQDDEAASKLWEVSAKLVGLEGK